MNVMLPTTELPFITKILVPKMRDHMVRRRRLLDRLTEGVNKKAQVVCAPAGYGKTALLVEFAAEVGLPLCWYSFSPEDRDPVRFLRYCVQAVRARFPDFGESCPSLLKGGLTDDRLTVLGLFTSSLHNDIPGRLIFVFDDVHLIPEKTDLGETLSLLIQRAPLNVHFVLGSRIWPSLPCLPRLAAENDLGTLEANDLRFSTDEAAQLLTHLWERPVIRDEANAVRDRTGGWAAAIVLIAKGHSTADGSGHMQTTDEGMLFSYLSEEVLDTISDPLQTFLLNTSIFREFTVSVCNKLLGLSSSEALIEQVKARGLFLEERTGTSTAYSYHDLFRGYLEQRFQSTDPDEYKRLNLGAADLYLDLGDDDAAIYHFLRGGEPDRAVEIVKEVSGAYYDQARWDRLSSWLGRLPQGTVERDPDLLLLSGQVMLRLGNPTDSLEELEKLVAGPHGNDPEVLGKALVAKSTAFRRLGHLELAADTAQEGLSVLQGTNCPQEHLAEAYKQLGDAFSMQGNFDSAKVNLQMALGLTTKERLRQYSLICNDLGVVYIDLGELDQAGMYLEQARIGFLKLNSQGPLAEALINLALVYYRKGEFDLALDEVGEALRIAQRAGYPRVLATVLMNLGMVQRALGAYNDSISSSSRALELARQLLDQRLIGESTEGLGTAYRKLGEISKAEVLLKQALLEAEDSDQKHVAAIYHISLGKVYYQLNSSGKALEHLAIAEEQLTAFNSFRRVAEVKLYQAAVYYRESKVKDAEDCLIRVADLITQLGYDGFLLANGDEVLDVVRFGAAKRLGKETYTHLLQRLTKTTAAQEDANGSQVGEDEVNRYPTLRAISFGYPRVILDTHEVTEAEWRSRKAKELFFFLLCKRRVVSNEEIIESLWPEVSFALSSSTLKTTVYRLRQALFFDCILAKESGYCINPEIATDLDMDRFLGNLNLGGDRTQNEEARIDYVKDAIELFRGPFLNGLYSDWCQEMQAELELKYHAALMDLATHYALKKNLRQAGELLETLVAADPYNENAQYNLIVNLLECGEIFTSLQRLKMYAKLCLEELGTDLPPRFRECHRRINTLLEGQIHR